MPLTISQELQSLIPPLTPEEFAQLETNILADGCHDPLIVWREEQTLLDGHNRHDICERHGVSYTTQEVSLVDLDAAKAWIIANQLGRRNLTPEQMSYFRGKQYEMQKRQGQKTDVTSGQNDQKSQTTAGQLAQQHKVSEKTIRRDAAYAHAVDVLAEVAGPETRQTLLARESKITQQDVQRLAAIAQVSPPTVQEVMQGVQVAKSPKTTKQIVQTAVEAAQKQMATVDNGTLAQAGVPRATLTRLAPKQAKPLLTEVGDTATPAPTPTTWPHNVSTGDFEWYTPPSIIALVKEVLGEIDVDPASCAPAQQVVGARTYYTAENDGLRQSWHGTVFLNPPYKMPEIARFCGKLLSQREAGHTTAAILLVNAATQTDWFQFIAPHADAVCFPDGKIRFIHATHNGLSPVQGQAMLYFGPAVERFREVFATLGLIMQVLGAKAAGPQVDLAEVPAPPTPQDEMIITRDAAGALILAVWLTVKKLQPCINAQVAKALGEQPKRTHQALQSLLKQGKVRKEDQLYSVVDA